jgi:Ca-activated chloride channel homolog
MPEWPGLPGGTGLVWPFYWYWALVLLPLPWLLRRWWRVGWSGNRALRLPPTLRLPCETLAGAGAAGDRGRRLAAAVWILLVLALARPWWLDLPAPLAAEGREFVIALDLSGSMQATDLSRDGRPLTRVDAARASLDALLEARHGDRVGLIVFGTRAYWLAPPSFDIAALRDLLEDARAGLAGERTAIGDAIGLALQRGPQAPARERVLVLLTDGRNTAGAIGPIAAADLAARAGLRIHTVGIGREGGAAGAGEAAGFDAATLRAVAERTGGQYLEAADAAALDRLASALQQLDPVRWDHSQGLRRELYPWPLALALVLALAGLAAAARRARQAEVSP